MEAAPPGPTIVDVALQVNAETGEFDTLIAALLAADVTASPPIRMLNGQFTPPPHTSMLQYSQLT